jgi:hypothetical protein
LQGGKEMIAFSNMIKRWNIIVTLVLLSFLPIAIFSHQQVEKTNAIQSDNSVKEKEYPSFIRYSFLYLACLIG